MIRKEVISNKQKVSNIIIVIPTYVSLLKGFYSFGLLITFGPIHKNIQWTIVNKMELISGL